MGEDPADTFTYYLPADASKPEAERRGLVYSHNTVRHWRKYDADLDAINQLRSIRAIDDAMLELLSRRLVRCIGFEALVDLQSSELRDVAEGLHMAAWLSEHEKKVSPSPAQSDAKSSAPGASPASA